MAYYDHLQYNYHSAGPEREGGWYAVTMLPRDPYGKLVFQDRESYQSYPVHWRSSVGIQKVDSVELRQESAEYRHVHGLVSQGMPVMYQIQRIFRIQNWYLWRQYAMNRVEMERKYGTAEGVERLLFHGTNCRNIDSICLQGFNSNLSVKSTRGFGTYFARDSGTSHHYIIPVGPEEAFPNVVQRAVVQPPPSSSQLGASYSNQLLWKVVKNHRPMESNPVLVRPRWKNAGGVASSQAPDPLHWQAEAYPYIDQNSMPPQPGAQSSPRLPQSEAGTCDASFGAAQPFGLHGDPLQGSSHVFITATTGSCVYQLLIPQTFIPLLQQAVDFLSRTGYAQESADDYLSVYNPQGRVGVESFQKYLQSLLQLATNERQPPAFPRQQRPEGLGFIPFQVKHPPPACFGDVFYVTWPGCDVGQVTSALPGSWFEPAHSPVGPQVWPPAPPVRSLQLGVQPTPRIPGYLNRFYMFVARVLVGRSKLGRPDYRKPPQLWENGPFADSCVDNEGHPQKFVIFNDHQTYPEYVVEYICQFRMGQCFWMY